MNGEKKNLESLLNQRISSKMGILIVIAVLVIGGGLAYGIIKLIVPDQTAYNDPVKVPDVVGLQVEDAVQVLEGLNFQSEVVEEEPDEEVAEGIVHRQNPVAGTFYDPKVIVVTVYIAFTAKDGGGDSDTDEFIDSDGDGVADKNDICPDEGDAGDGVDVNGCPVGPVTDIDSDGDGIYDFKDECPFQGDMGEGIDEVGCPPDNGEIPQFLVDDSGTSMVLIPTGGFVLGTKESTALSECLLWNGDDLCDMQFYADEEPVQSVLLSNFYIDQYEVTNVQYLACVEAGVCSEPFNLSSYSRTDYFGSSTYDDYPVINVTWYDAQTYCEWRGARLPTEQEWEKAARGTDERLYPWGNVFDIARANFCDDNCNRKWSNSNFNDGYGDTAPVGSYPNGASPYQVYDMAGNVSEWVADIYGPYEGGIADDSSPYYGSTFVRRGGSWYSLGNDLRLSRRDDDLPYPDEIDDINGIFGKVGFRCAVDP